MSVTNTPLDYPFPLQSDIHHPAPELAALREERPVTRVRTPDGGHAWLVTRHADVRTVMSDPRFSRAAASGPDVPRTAATALAAPTIIGMDPPEHTRIRRLVAGTFTVRRIEDLRPRVQKLVDELLTAMAELPRPVDLVENFSLPLPVQVICELLGVPISDRPVFRELADAMLLHGQTEIDAVMAGYERFCEYFTGLITEKRRNPDDALLSALIAARDEGDRLSEDELTALSVTLLTAGHETTANSLGLHLLALLRYPEELRRLRENPGMIKEAVEELLRFTQLLTSGAFLRVTTEEVELSGVTIPAGEAVIPDLVSANRDADVFPDADELRLTREKNPHVAFGTGVHHCLGAQLARMELQVGLAGLLGRFPALRLAVPADELTLKKNMVILSLESMPVTW